MTIFLNNSFQDVRQYPENYLKIDTDGVCISVTYKKLWDDDFGARGWKIDATIEDPVIIASTRETGQKITTSVFVHDILDHFLSGFGVSGHRSEAMALIQLSNRTKSSPKADYEQMVKEDIINGRVNGEPLATFLPEQLQQLLTPCTEMTNKEKIAFLKKKCGDKKLTNLLVEHFFTLGKAGEMHATDSWIALGLNPEKQTETGLALQKLLTVIDSKAEETNIDKIRGYIKINDNDIVFSQEQCDGPKGIYDYRVTID